MSSATIPSRDQHACTRIDVSNIWAQWLRTHLDQLQAIHMLTGSRFVQLTADFVRRFAELGDAMRIYTDVAAFDEVL